MLPKQRNILSQGKNRVISTPGPGSKACDYIHNCDDVTPQLSLADKTMKSLQILQ